VTQDRKDYDYVIVGAGSAGCTLACRLTEDPGVRVLLLEAGGWDRDPRLGIPLLWARNMLARRHDWMYDTDPEPALEGRRIEAEGGFESTPLAGEMVVGLFYLPHLE